MRNDSFRTVQGVFAAALLTSGVAGALAWFVLPSTRAQAQELTAVSPNAEAWKDFQYQDAASCSLCHAGPTAANKGQGSLNLVVMAEYAVWKTHDKHAQAYAVLEGKRGQQIAKILGIDVTKAE